MPAAVVARCAGLDEADVVLDTHRPVIAGVGTPFVIAEVTAEALGRAQGDAGAMRGAARRYPVRPIGFPLHLHAAGEGGKRRARMFSPLSGIPEDPATGSANVALVALLLHAQGGERLALDVEQGVEMGRPSLLRCAAWRTEGPGGEAAVMSSVGGSAVAVMRGSLQA